MYNKLFNCMRTGGQRMSVGRFHTYAKCNSLEPVSDEYDVSIATIGDSVFINGELVPSFSEGIAVEKETPHTNMADLYRPSLVSNCDDIAKSDKANNNQRFKNGSILSSKRSQKSSSSSKGLAAILRGESITAKRKQLRSASKMSSLFEEFSLSKIRVSFVSYFSTD